jgi:hypothetical protein
MSARSNGEKHMHKHGVIFATTLLALGVATSADAMTISAPTGLRPAIQETTTTQKVYWGWGGYYRPVYVARPIYVVRPIVVAPVFWGPRYYARPIFWGGPRFYGRRFYGW